MIFTYEARHKKAIMDSFGLEAKEGVVVDKNTGNPVKDNLNSNLTPKNFGGVRKGSLEFINSDVASLLKLRKKLNEDK